MGKRVQAREKRRGGQHGSAVVVVYLGHGELEGGHGRLWLRGYGSALLAVHERRWCEGERQWGGVEKWRGSGGVFIPELRSMVDTALGWSRGRPGSP